MLKTQHIFINGIHRATFQREVSWQVSPIAWQIARSTSMFCHHCGTHWATLFIEDYSESWSVQTQCCENCFDEETPSGSLLTTQGHYKWSDPILVERLPENLLQRELKLHLNWFDKKGRK